MGFDGVGAWVAGLTSCGLVLGYVVSSSSSIIAKLDLIQLKAF